MAHSQLQALAWPVFDRGKNEADNLYAIAPESKNLMDFYCILLMYSIASLHLIVAV